MGALALSFQIADAIGSVSPCGFQRIPAMYSNVMAATVPI